MAVKDELGIPSKMLQKVPNELEGTNRKREHGT